jgi:hypothetical protein
MTVPPKVVELVERFRRNLDVYKRDDYKETRVRVEFVDPFFEALGWDMRNVQGYAEQYKEVVHEATLKMGGEVRAPDYSFRIGGVPKFYLEAKKPSVWVKKDIGPAYQLRRYAWSAKLPLSVLTDFEEFAVYDCRQRPNPKDKASVGRVMYLTFDDYPHRWDEIYGILAKESVLKGSFDRYVSETKRKRGTAEVDAEFLKEIEGWRETLARNIALRNPALSVHELNYAVQRTIDRLIFLRMAEDRGIEEYGRLRRLTEAADIYVQLGDLYRQADERYNAGLFDWRKDTLTPALTVDDRALKPILSSLYYPECPYEFSVLPADVLGQVYEQFLGKVIRLTPAHRAVVEEKPEVKKAGGVYYTPTYIVDYIVAQTVGELVEGKTPRQMAKLRILDPACGSGSFLLGAYQYLLDTHLRWYEADDPEKHARGRQPAVYRAPSPTPPPSDGGDAPTQPPPLHGGGEGGGGWRLTTAEKKRILLNNIYGVDIDRQAVEVTKLSLLLKVLEGETDESLGKQLTLWREPALPDLADNIKCGNSLIGPDYFEAQLLPDEAEMRRVNPFDWGAEFPHVFAPSQPSPTGKGGQSKGWGGGFDCVIGNPPYVRMEEFKDVKSYLKSHYLSHDERSDLYVYFVERGLGLLQESGYFGMIISNKFLRAKYGQKLRGYLSTEAQVDRITDFAGLPVFAGATVRTIVLVATKRKTAPDAFLYTPPVPSDVFATVQGGSKTVSEAVAPFSYNLDTSSLDDDVWSLIPPHEAQLLDRLALLGQPLANFCDNRIFMGVKSGLTKAFVIDEDTRTKIIAENPKATEIIKPYLNGRDVRRYQVQSPGLYLIYTYHGVSIEQYPAIEKHLKPFKARLQRRATKQAWYELQQPQRNFAEYMDDPKLVFPDIATMPRFALDADGHYGSNTTYFIPGDDLYLLGILNSRVAFFYFSRICAALEGPGESYLRFFGQYLSGFPVRTIDFHDPADAARRDQMVALVERMLDLHKKLAAASIPDDKTLYQRQIAATDAQIDALVYELYSLTEEEIAIVEEATR